MHTNLDTVVDVARLLYGTDWQRPLARGLGSLHPDGARDTMDDRLIRRWASGERTIPDWVGPALVQVLRRQSDLYVRRALAFQSRAADLETELASLEPDEAPEMEMRI